MTQRCHDYISSLALVLPACRIADFVDVSDSTVERIVRSQRKALRDRFKPYLPKAIGIDEVRIRGTYRLIIVDLDENVIVDLLPDHTDPTLQTWLNQFGQTFPGIEYVTMDQTERYRTVFKKRAPNAEIVYDKFHFVQLINKSVTQVYRKAGTAKSRTKQASIQRRVLCAREINLDLAGQLMLNGLLANDANLSKAHQVKEDFHDLIRTDYTSRKKAGAAITEWLSTIPRQLEADFSPVIKASNNWRPQVEAMLLARRKTNPAGFYTNSPTEGLNRMVKLAALSTPSANFEQVRLRLILAQRNKLDIPACACCATVKLAQSTNILKIPLCSECASAVLTADR